MKTMTTKNKRKAWLPILLLAIGIFSINVLWACTANFTYTIGLNGHVTFKSTSTGVVNQTQYSWNFGDNTTVIAYNDTSLVHTYQSNGTFSVILYINSDTSSCFDSIRIPVVITNVTTPCVLSAAYTYTLNANGATSFTSTSTGTNANTLYYWNAGDGSGTTLGTNTFSHTYAVQGYYEPKLIIKDTGSAYCIDSIAQYIDVNTPDSNSCGLHAGFTYTTGLNGHITFKSNSYVALDSTYSYFYNWNAGDGSSSTGNTYDSTFNHIYTANGTYTVSVIVTSAIPGHSCTDSAAVIITVSNITTPCTLSAGFNIINDTTKGQVQLISTSTGTYAGTQYYWRVTNGSISDSSAVNVLGGSSYTTTFSSNGSYWVWLILKDTGSVFCQDSVAELVNISNVDSLHASFINTYTNDTIGNYIYSFLSTSTGTNDATMYAWEPGDSTAGDTGVSLTTYVHQYKYPGAHTVTLSLWFDKYPAMPGHKAQGFGGTKYDFTTYSETVYVGSPQSVATISASGSETKLYPNPNNGSFRIIVNGVTDNKNAEVEITNILGEVVYQTTATVSNGMISKDITLPGVSNGTYFVRVITSGNVYNSKTVINK
jgi:hypothetical protein